MNPAVQAYMNTQVKGLSKRAAIDPDTLKIMAMYGVPVLGGAGIGALLYSRNRVLGALLGGVGGAAVGGGLHAAYASRKYNSTGSSSDRPGKDYKKESLKKADPDSGKWFAESAAHACQLYSAQRGGQGKSKFPASLLDIKENGGMPQTYNKSMDFEGHNKVEPTDGYVLYMDRPTSVNADGTANSYRIYARPAPGYTGPSFSVGPDMKVQQID